MSSQSNQTNIKMGRIRTKLSMIGRLQLLLTASRKSGEKQNPVVRCSSPSEKQAMEIRDEWKVSFENLLDDPVGLQTFTEFLHKEYSEENIKFWQECQAYTKVTDASERQTQAKHIYETYLGEGATEPVNVDSAAVKVVQEQLDKPSETIFSIAQFQIFNLMRTDSYRRFLKSAKKPQEDQNNPTATKPTAPIESFSPKPARLGRQLSKEGGLTTDTKEHKLKSMTLPAYLEKEEQLRLPPDVLKYMKHSARYQHGQSHGNHPTHTITSLENNLKLKPQPIEGATLEKYELFHSKQHTVADNYLDSIVSDIEQVWENSDLLNRDIKSNVNECLEKLGDGDSSIQAGTSTEANQAQILEE